MFLFVCIKVILWILWKKISYFRSDPFTFIDLELPTNSHMIACTDTRGFEEGENCASTISVEHTLGSDMNFFGYDMILFGYDLLLLGYRVQEISVPLVVVLINLGVKNKYQKSLSKVLLGI